MNMFETLYLHIGIEKTGTTSIQKSLDQNRDALLELGYYYPTLFAVGLNTRLAAMFLTHAMSRANMKLIIDKNGGTQETHFNEMNKSLSKEIKSIDVPNLVLSSEFLAGGTEINRLKAWCKTLAREVKVIIYLREQCSLFVSHQSTNLKGGGTPIDIKSIKKRQDLSAIYNVKGMVSRWEKAFPGQLDIRIFHRDRLVGGDAVQDFYQALEIKDWRPSTKTDQSNISLSLVGSAFLKKMNDMIPLAKDGELNPVRARIIEDIGVQDSEDDYGKGRLTREEGEIIGSLFTESNEAVRSRYFPDQAQLFPKYKTGKAKPVSDEDILDYAIKLLDKAYSNQFETTKTMQILRAEHKRGQEDLISKVDLVKTERNELLDRSNRQEEKRINHIKGLKTQIQNLQEDRDAARGQIKNLSMPSLAGAKKVAAEFEVKLDALKSERASLVERLNAQKETTGNHINALKEQVEKLQEDRDAARIKYSDLVEKSEADLRSAMTTLNTKLDAMRDERDAILEKFNRRAEKEKIRRQEVATQMKKLTDALDVARVKLKDLTETSKLEKKEAVSTFNGKMEALRAERDTALKQAKSSGKKHDKKFETLSAQILALTKARDEARGVATDKDKTIKSLTKARDDARKAFDTKEKQAKIQSGQVYYFRAELLRLKENFTEARKMYEKAVEQDPDNETYQNRLADLEE